MIRELEQLESRTLLACTITQSFSGAVTIRGDNLANDVTVVDHGDGSVDFDCDAASLSATDVIRVRIQTRGGDDTVNYSADADLEGGANLRVDLGLGNDTAVVDLSDDGAVTSLDDITLDVLGGAGDDDIDVALGGLDAADVDAVISAGAGNDVVGIFLDGNLVGSYLLLDVLGGAGADLIDMVTQDDAGDPRAIGIDDGSVLDSILDGGSGNDDVYMDLVFADDSLGEAVLDVRGGSGNDDLTLLTFNEAGDAATDVLVDAELNGGRGYDTADVTDNVVVVGV